MSATPPSRAAAPGRAACGSSRCRAADRGARRSRSASSPAGTRARSPPAARRGARARTLAPAPGPPPDCAPSRAWRPRSRRVERRTSPPFYERSAPRRSPAAARGPGDDATLDQAQEERARLGGVVEALADGREGLPRDQAVERRLLRGVHRRVVDEEALAPDAERGARGREGRRRIVPQLVDRPAGHQTCAGRDEREAEAWPVLRGDAPEIGGGERRRVGRVEDLEPRPLEAREGDQVRGLVPGEEGWQRAAEVA